MSALTFEIQIPYLLNISFIYLLLGFVYGTCVFESDFGLILNCNFKKSGLFRVRNLGGVKAHFGFGKIFCQ